MTTIHVSPETKAQLDRLKVHPRETYEEVVKRLIRKVLEMGGQGGV